MTTIPSDTTVQNQSTPTTAEDQALEESLVTIVNTLTGSKKTVADLGGASMSEDVLFAALVYKQLKKDSPATAKSMLKELKSKFDERTKANNREPLYRTIDDVLNEAVKSKKLTKSKADTITADAFGKAQLDKTKGALGRTARKGGINTILDKVHTNKSATLKKIENYEKDFEKRSLITPSVARRQRKELDKIVKSMKHASTDPGSTTPTTGGSGSSTTPKGIETDKPGDAPDPSKLPSEPNDLVYNPSSLKDGNALVMLPLLYSNRVNRLEVISENEDVLREFKYSGKGDDGRAYFRDSSPGGAIHGNVQLRLHLVDGRSLDIWVGDSSKFALQRYLST